MGKYCALTADSLSLWIGSPLRSTKSKTKEQHIRRTAMKKVIVITGASSGFGALTARALAKAGHETSIIVPGAFTGGTNHFAHAGSPADKARVGEYEAGPYKGFADDVLKGFSSIVPPDANIEGVADAIVKIVALASDRSVCTTIQRRTERKLSIW